jgi:predicted small lipoprotein YifL
MRLMLFLVVLALPLAGCGKKGDLYLPSPAPAPAQTTPSK